VQSFLSTGLRLRTACDLAAVELVVKAPVGFDAPSLSALTSMLPELIRGAHKHFASPATTVATFNAAEKKAKKAKAS
jgi:hypothetical protein